MNVCHTEVLQGGGSMSIYVDLLLRNRKQCKQLIKVSGIHPREIILTSTGDMPISFL